MTTLHDRATAFGGKLYANAVCVPADMLVAFLEAEAAAGRSVLYIECLYFHAGSGAEPSMDLSRTLEDAGGMMELVVIARSVVTKAIEGARTRSASAFFEVAANASLAVARGKP